EIVEPAPRQGRDPAPEKRIARRRQNLARNARRSYEPDRILALELCCGLRLGLDLVSGRQIVHALKRPLTPALSPQAGRGRARERWRKAFGVFGQRLAAAFPLPVGRGEGQGEGQSAISASHHRGRVLAIPE